MVNKNFLWLSIIYTLLIFFISLIPLPNIIIPDFNLFQPDKLVHFIIYFIMLYLWLKSNSVKENKFRLKSLILVLFISFFIETLQGTSFIKRRLRPHEVEKTQSRAPGRLALIFYSQSRFFWICFFTIHEFSSQGQVHCDPKRSVNIAIRYC